MKTYCKGIDPSDIGTIRDFVLDAVSSKLKRKDYSEFVAGFCALPGREIRRRARTGAGMYPELDDAIRKICEEISGRIERRDLNLDPIRYDKRTEGLSRKTRIIGIESVMQQVMEHVAVGCMGELWAAKYEFHQYASIKGKGQLAGARTIQKWTKAGMTTCFVKLDVRSCFASLTRETAMRWLCRDIGKNAVLLWFADALLQMHGSGLVIGSLLSQFLCNYFMSYAYRFVMGLHKTRRGKQVKLCSCALFYMDDIMLAGRDRRNLLMATRKLIVYMQAAFGLEVKPGWYVRRHTDCGIDMMGFVITSRGRIRIRPRIFIRARRAFVRSAQGDNRLGSQRRVSAYYGFFKAAKIRHFHARSPTGGRIIHICAIQRKAAILTANEARRRLKCSA